MSNRKLTVTRAGVLRFVLCLASAFLLWLFVMYTESPEYDRQYDGIRVEVRNAELPYGYDLVYPETVSASFRGTNVALAGCSSDDITAVIYLDGGSFTGTKAFVVEYEFKNDVKLKALDEKRIEVECRQANLITREFASVPVTLSGIEGTALEKYDIEISALTNIVAKGRPSDIQGLTSEAMKATVKLTAATINDIVAGTHGPTFEVSFESESGMTYTTESGDVPTVTITFTPTASAEQESTSGVESDSADNAA